MRASIFDMDKSLNKYNSNSTKTQPITNENIKNISNKVENRSNNKRIKTIWTRRYY